MDKFDDNIEFDSVDVSHEHAHPAEEQPTAPVSRASLPKWQPFILPAAILIAAVLVSSTILYAKYGGRSGTTTTKVQPQLVELKLDASDHILGDPKAKVTVVEFADFRCPFCERLFQQVEGQLLSDYVNSGKVRFVFKHYAFLGQQSTWASQAAECAGQQNKFWEYHNWLYQNQADESNLNYYSKANLIKYAGKVSGMNIANFAACLNSDSTAKRVADDLALGQSLAISGTPTTLVMVKNNSKFDVAYINNQLQVNQYVINLPNGNYFIVGAQPFDAFKTVLDAVLK